MPTTPESYLDADDPNPVIGLDAGGNKIDPMGRAIDNFFRGLIPGSLPQAPEQVQIGTTGAPKPALGIQVGTREEDINQEAGGEGIVAANSPVPGTTVEGPGEFEPGAIGADVFEDPNSFDPFGNRFDLPTDATQPTSVVEQNPATTPVAPMRRGPRGPVPSYDGPTLIDLISGLFNTDMPEAAGPPMGGRGPQNRNRPQTEALPPQLQAPTASSGAALRGRGPRGAGQTQPQAAPSPPVEAQVTNPNPRARIAQGSNEPEAVTSTRTQIPIRGRRPPPAPVPVSTEAEFMDTVAPQVPTRGTAPRVSPRTGGRDVRPPEETPPAPVGQQPTTLRGGGGSYEGSTITDNPLVNAVMRLLGNQAQAGTRRVEDYNTERNMANIGP